MEIWGKSVLNRGTAYTGTQVSGTSEEPHAEACEWVQREGGKVGAGLLYCRSTVTSVLRETNAPGECGQRSHMEQPCLRDPFGFCVEQGCVWMSRGVPRRPGRIPHMQPRQNMVEAPVEVAVTQFW